MCDKKTLQTLINKSLLSVNQKNMVDRYNSALLLLTGKKSSLESFHIDCCGYSPEIAEEFGDEYYLNPYGVNRQFILIDICQEDLPSVMASFSSSPFIIKSFIAENRPQILALTAQDSVYGYIENNTPKVEQLSDILDITKVKVICDTPTKIVESNKLVTELQHKLYHGDPKNLLCHDKINELAELCKRTKSTNYSCYLPTADTFTKESFYTGHFGGFYLLQRQSPKSSAFKVIIYLDKDKFPLSEVPSGMVAIHWQNYSDVIRFLKKHRILVPICKTVDKNHKIESLEDIKKRVIYDFLLSSNKIEFDNIDDLLLSNTYFKDNADNMPDEYIKINNIVKMIEKDTADKSYSDKYGFYSLKINPIFDETHIHSLLNHLIVNYTEYSYRRTFLYNIELFMKRFDEASDGTKKLMIRYIESLNDDFV